MATIAKFYLHDAATSNTGTMPSTAAGSFISSGDANGDATGATSSLSADDVIGALQKSSLITATANQTLQLWGHRRFVSAPLAATSFAATDGNWTFSYASSESNTNHHGQIRCNIYAWRPTTGAQVGSGVMVSFIGTAMASTSEVADSVTNTSTSLSILDGDILVFEVFDRFQQTMSSAYTSSFFYDGTTEASASSCASFVTPPAALTLLGGGNTYVKAGTGVMS